MSARKQGRGSGLLVWGAGYSRMAAQRGSVSDLERLRKLGGAVLFAAAWAAIEWAAASHGFLIWVSTPARIAFGVGLFVIGASFVLCFDRASLYLMDTRLTNGGMRWWLALRIIIIIAFSTFTAMRAMPALIGPDLAQQALKAREQSEAERQANLNARFDVPHHLQQANSADGEVRRVEEESRVVPTQIAASLSSARECRRAVAADASSLRRAGYSARQARTVVAPRAARCSRAERAAHANLAAWRAEVGGRLRDRRSQAAEARQNYASATAAVAERVSNASRVEAEALVPESAHVLLLTLRNNPTAALTAIFFIIVSLTVQLLPFILKGIAGRTALGTRLAAEQAADSLEPMTKLTMKEHEAEVAVAASEHVAIAMREALATEEVRSFLRHRAAEHTMRLAPAVAALRELREIQDHTQEFENIVNGTPELAAIAYRLWMQAIQDIYLGASPMRSAPEAT